MFVVQLKIRVKLAVLSLTKTWVLCTCNSRSMVGSPNGEGSDHLWLWESFVSSLWIYWFLVFRPTTMLFICLPSSLPHPLSLSLSPISPTFYLSISQLSLSLFWSIKIYLFISIFFAYSISIHPYIVFFYSEVFL